MLYWHALVFIAPQDIHDQDVVELAGKFLKSLESNSAIVRGFENEFETTKTKSTTNNVMITNMPPERFGNLVSVE